MKKNISIVCNFISIILILAFGIKVMIDYSEYTVTLNSAPFYIWVLADALYLLLPAMIVFAVGRAVKKEH